MSRPEGVYSRDDWAHVPGAKRHSRRFSSDVIELHCDAVVVGSGAGGSVVAAELAEGGLDVVVIEEGGYFGTESFDSDVGKAIANLYRDGGAAMAIGAPPVTYAEGKCVGGSTVINGGMSWRTPERILDRWRREDWVDRIDAQAMEPYFERVEAMISRAHQDPWTVGRDNQLLKEGADKKGWKVIPNTRNQFHCAGSNNCAFGCPTGAKRSALVTYVPRALHFGARILTDGRVDRLISHGKKIVGVEGRVVRRNATDGLRFKVHAPHVVLAAGAVHTPGILLRSGIVSPSGKVGHNLTLHPNTKVTALFDEDVRGWEGVHQAYQVREFQEEGFLFAAVNIPPSIVAMTLSHRGPALRELMAKYDKMLIAGMLCEDTVTGRVRLLGGKPQAFYQLSDLDAERLVRGTALLCELLFDVGAKRIVIPFEGVPELFGPDDVGKLFARKVDKAGMEVVTVHIMGTACMGGDRSRHVCDSYGRVYDADGLYVADASLFPSPIGVNPMQTIMSLATRNAARILDRSLVRS